MPLNRPESSSQPDHLKEIAPGKDDDAPTVASGAELSEVDLRKKRRHEERRDEVKMCEERRDEKRRREKHEKKRFHDPSVKQKHRHREKGKRRHDSN